MLNPLLDDLNVSRETFERLEWYQAQVLKWTKRINLISRSTEKDIWSRHILDSSQLFPHGEACSRWLDIGSGGGFPGIVLAILAKEARPKTSFTLVDSDQRKCAFLRTVVREAELNARVLSCRIESLPGQRAETLSARALAGLTTVLGYCQRHLADDGIALLQKGESWEKEVTRARQHLQFDLETITSVTKSRAVLLKIRNITRA